MLPINSLDSLALLGIAPYSVEQLRLVKALRDRSMFKLICGAGYSDFNSIKKYSEIFTKAGAHIINVSAHPIAVSAAKEGINNSKVSLDNQPIIMISVSLDHNSDPRFKRISLDENACDNCGDCVNVCATSAFSQKDNKLIYKKEKCSGCGDCPSVCHADALTLEPVNALNPDILPELWSLGARCIEVYTGPNFYWLEPYIRRIKEISPHSWMFSVVLNSEFSSYQELKEQAIEIHNLLGDGALVQVEGSSDNNQSQRNDSLSMFKALYAANALLESERPLFIQIAGGVNDKIRNLISQFNIRVHGIAMDSYARKLVEPHLDDPEIAVAIASKLVNSVKNL